MSSHYISAEDFEPHSEMNDLSDYRWNDRMVNHLFCKTCGIYPYHGDDKIGYRVNLGCVDELDIFALDIEVLDGRAMPLADAPNPG